MSLYDSLRRCLEEERLIAQVTIISDPGLGKRLLVWPTGTTEGELGDRSVDEAATRAAQEAMTEKSTGPVTLDLQNREAVELFIEVFPPPEKLVIVGAVHAAMPLVTFAQALGMRTVVVDARATFATKERFPDSDELILRWPADALADMNLNEGSYLVFLTHDPKLDNPALQVALASEAPYVGALGSKRTHAKRVAALQEMGVTAESIDRIHAPIGLDLGGRRPEEIAVSIIAQIVQARHGRV